MPYVKRKIGFAKLIIIGILTTALTVLAVAMAKDRIIDNRQAEIVEQLKTDMVPDLEGLAGRLAAEQVQFMPILPPDPEFRLHQTIGMYVFDPAGFPKDFLSGLVYDIERGCPVYTVTLQENSLTGEILFYNGEGKTISSLPPVRDYDAWWLFEHFHPELYYTGKVVDEPLAEFMALFNPIRLAVELKLISTDYVETYSSDIVAALAAAEAVESMFSRTTKGGAMQSKMLRQERASTSIVVAAISPVTTNIRLTVQYPNDFTNRLEIFTCADLRNSWGLIATNLSTVGTNEIQWTDTAAGGVSNRFYVACDADTDSDNDGLVDGREQRMYQTCATNIDTDGDGLVDGFSGVVSTNSYPNGVFINGGLYVEGELTWATDPHVVDTDADGMGDGWEVANGHNPADENDPPNVSGTVIYTGRQTGTVHVVAVTDSGSWSTNASCTLATSNVYHILHLEQTNYWLKAWMDTEVDGITNATEACGVYTNASIVITNRITGKDIVLADPDNDTDGVPDWWEMAHFGSITNPATDPDGDNYNNQEEYDAGTDPTNTLSHPWNLGGTITYTGPQTGTVWVAACTDGATWNWARVATNAQPGAYTITHLPPNTNYWVRAWLDINGDGVPPSGATSWEAWGTHSGNPVMLDTNVVGVNVTLTDPDNDADSLPDWWEVRYGLNPTAGGAGGAVAWWKLDEAAGTNAVDSVGTNYGLLCGFATNAWMACVVGNGLAFDGSNTYVSVPDSVDLKPVTIGLGLWIKPSVTYTNGKSVTFLSKEVGIKGYNMGYTNGALLFRFWVSGSACEVTWPCALTDGVPVHVVGYYDGSWQRLYVNAQLKAEANYNWGSGFGNISQGTNALRLGAAVADPAGDVFAGLLDDVRITDDEWTSNQVHAVWELGADPDGDGLNNVEEYQAGTDPGDADTDRDGMNDGWETRYGFSPISAADATEDFDNDGYLNIYEAKHSSDPTSISSVPSPTHLVTNGIGTIQGMINSVTQDYAVVQVKAGTYTGSENRNIDFGGKKLMLVSEFGAEVTIINCQQWGRGMVFASNETRATVVKGFTIRNGCRNVIFQDEFGGGILCSNSSPTIFDCILTNNIIYVYYSGYYNYGFGGALACLGDSAPLIVRCDMKGNDADYGGAVACYYTQGAAPIIRDSSIVDNGMGISLFGGGIWAFGSAVITNCLIMGNYAVIEGGGLYCGETTHVAQCQIIDNIGEAWGGGGIAAEGNVTIENCWIHNNTAIGQFGINASGGGITLDNDAVAKNCDISGNQVQWGDGGGVAMSGFYGGMARVENCSISNNSIANTGYHGYGAGVYSRGPYNTNATCSHVIQDCTMSSNYGAEFGGGVAALDSTLVLRRSVVVNNTANRGGGVAVVTDTYEPQTNLSPRLENSVIENNESIYEGDAVYVEASTGTVTLLNCTITGQTAGEPVVFVSNTTALAVRNSILWGNSGTLFHVANSTVTMEYSCVQGGYAGTGNITNNPLLHPDGYHLLSANSPCWNTSSTNAPVEDIDGEVRPKNGGIDMGADEFADADDDGLPDYWELNYFDSPTNAEASADSDSDGITNSLEFLYATDPNVADTGDADGDGLIDAVERSLGTDLHNPDTDGDGMRDGWEVQYGLNPLSNDALVDADGDGVQNLAEWYWEGSPTNTDSDADGLLDGAEVLGTVMGSPSDPANPDSDGDGIPDGQDIFPNSPSGDQDGDGIPDSLDSNADNDGIVSSFESYSGTYPSTNGLGTFALYPDSDGDGVPDGVDYDPDNPEVWQNPGSPDSIAPVISVLAPLEGVSL